MTPEITPPVPTTRAIAEMNSTRGLVVKSPRWRMPARVAWSATPVPALGSAVSVTSLMFSLEVPNTSHHDIFCSTPGLALMARRLNQQDYRLLSEFRYQLRRFLEFSEAAAARAGLTPRQHQALLAIKGAPECAIPSIGHLAERLRIRHHSAVELVDRLAEAGLITREPDPEDRRRVRLKLTPSADERLARLSADHLAELNRLRPALLELLLADQPKT